MSRTGSRPARLGEINAHAVPTNSRAVAAFRYHVVILWYRQLRRRSQRVRLVWERMAELADQFLPKPRVLHPWPSVRFAVKHPRYVAYKRASAATNLTRRGYM